MIEPLPEPESVRGKYKGLLKVDLEELEEERKERLLDSIPETVRMILSEYFSKRD